MYINKIDELVDKVIDDYYSNIINKNILKKIIKDDNFVKYQKDINQILSSYIELINKKDIEELVPDADNVNIIIEIIKRYLGYYTFMVIGFFYSGKKETYINNVIEFTKNQPSFKLRIDGFFNSENNSNIIRFTNIAKNIALLVESNKPPKLTNNEDMNDAVEYIEKFGKEIFALENLGGDEFDQCHNIVKLIIINELYFGEDKKDVFLILESAEKDKGIYMFIDIVVPRMEYIDFNSIENVLTKDDIDRGIANEIYEMIILDEDLNKLSELSVDDKILTLLNHKIVTPITEDFLLYHKDTEKYEKTSSYDQKKKKEDTKIRYIVSKIDRVSEYYSESAKKDPNFKKEIEKQFYLPLSDRLAVLVNNSEELKILHKIHNQGKATIENNEYYNDLLNLRMYPYANFKDFKKYGFSINTNKTIDAVRSMSFDNAKPNNDLQLRVGSNGQLLNITGFMVPSNKISLHCLKSKDVFDVRKLGYKGKSNIKKYNNGYDGILKYIKHLFLKNKKYDTGAYWLFDLKRDIIKMEKYEQMTKINANHQIKLMIAKLYDDILQAVHNKIYRNINAMKAIDFKKFLKTINGFEKKIFPFPKDSELYLSLQHLVFYEKYVKSEKKYDVKEDKFPGLEGDIIKLPDAPPKKKDKIATISLQDIIETEKDEIEKTDIEKTGAICQHFITWEKMGAIRKKSPNTFNDMLFEFINHFVVVNQEDDHICKSCGTQINLKNYVIDGSYDDEGRFITFSMPMEIPLEDVPEYEKYRVTIRNLDKIIDRISGISNMPYFIGSSSSVKWRKRGVIKDAIDLLLIHNKNLKNIYKERKERVLNSYGINKELTNLFVFELENNIFIYSSKDKDYYKPIKQNNVLIYLIMLMLLELNDSQIIFMGGDRICNYYFFEKYGFSLFENINIRINNKNDTAPINQYKTLCYIIYFVSCMITKYNMWYSEIETKSEKTTPDQAQKSKKFNPLTQKIIIHTLVDFINSIIEFYGKKKKHYLYEIISLKFIKKLQSTFGNDDILEKIKRIEYKKIITQDGKKKYVTTKIKSIELADSYEPGKYMGTWLFKGCYSAKSYIPKRVFERIRYYNVNNVTNCETGEFHDWKVKGKTFECVRCKEQLDKLTLNTQLLDKIREKFRYKELAKLANKYCKTGKFHNFVYDASDKCSICTKCNLIDTHTPTEKELDELDKNIVKMKAKIENKHITEFKNKQDKEAKREAKLKGYIGKLKSEYGQSKTHREDYFRFLNDLANKFEAIIGKNININNENTYIRYDTYFIDHDHNGFKLQNPMIIINNDDKIIFKKNHSFFKTDVFYYTNYKIGKIDVFYDSKTKTLLGYKEQNKEFQYSKNTDKHIKINYSIINKLKLLGYSSKFIDISDDVSNLKKYFKDQHNELIVKELVSGISRNRIKRLKKVIMDIQRFLYRIKYNYNEDLEQDKEIEKTGFDITDKYKNKLSKMNIYDPVTKKDKAYKFWKAIKYSIFFQNISAKDINLSADEKYFNAEDITEYDYHGNLILYYITREMSRLLDFNNDKFIKTTMVYLFFDIINAAHDEFNIEDLITNFEIKRFNYIMTSNSYIHDIEEKGHGLEGETTGFYGEQIDPDDPIDQEELEALDIAQEELDAIDMEGEMDYVIDYAPGINMS